MRLRAMLLGTSSPAASPTALDPAGVVDWFGALQSQDWASGLWS